MGRLRVETEAGKTKFLLAEGPSVRFRVKFGKDSYWPSPVGETLSDERPMLVAQINDPNAKIEVMNAVGHWSVYV